jgi:hypothetical protein
MHGVMSKTSEDNESICDLPMIKAKYQWIERKGRLGCDGFRILLHPPGSRSRRRIEVGEADAEQFAAELEALAALMRARILRCHNQNSR